MAQDVSQQQQRLVVAVEPESICSIFGNRTCGGVVVQNRVIIC